MNLRFLFPQATNMTRDDARTAIALLAAIILTTVHRQACGVDTLAQLSFLDSETARAWTYHSCTMLLFGLVPLALIFLFWKSQPISRFGVTIGDWKFGLAAVGILLPVIAVVLLLPAAELPDMQAVYPVDHTASRSVADFLPYAIGRILLFYVAWEFFFRGFLLFSLRETLGDIPALLVSVMPSVLWHIGYPTGELYSSIVGGIMFAWLALRTGSILWPLLLHAGIGMVTDISISLAL
ncbi:MAG: CPBP family intramembrane metalloprotease [Bacteroidetes bacterium]|nr:CPBP family intramembrane metalloprotease [Bacteroidota bacterium]